MLLLGLKGMHGSQILCHARPGFSPTATASRSVRSLRQRLAEGRHRRRQVDVGDSPSAMATASAADIDWPSDLARSNSVAPMAAGRSASIRS